MDCSYICNLFLLPDLVESQEVMKIKWEGGWRSSEDGLQGKKISCEFSALGTN